MYRVAKPNIYTTKGTKGTVAAARLDQRLMSMCRRNQLIKDQENAASDSVDLEVDERVL